MPPEPLILAFDTSAAHCAAALLSGDQILDNRVEPMARGQAERLFPLLEEILSDANLTWADLTAIGVGIGPGNFTGIRISVAAARGLALSLGIPAHGVSTFEALAFDLDRPLVASVDARGERSYLQSFTDNGHAAPGVAETASLGSDWHKKPFPVVGHAAEEIAGQLRSEVAVQLIPQAVAIARIAAGRGPGTPNRPAPLYVRPADAAPSRDSAPKILP